MEHAYLIIHINSLTREITGANIYSEWPLASHPGNGDIIDVCILHKQNESYAKARTSLLSEILGFPMVQSHLMGKRIF